MISFLPDSYRNVAHCGQISHLIASRRPDANLAMSMASEDKFADTVWQFLKNKAQTGAYYGALTGYAAVAVGTAGTLPISEFLVGTGYAAPRQDNKAFLYRFGLSHLVTDKFLQNAGVARQDGRGLSEALWAALAVGLFGTVEKIRIVNNLMVGGAEIIAALIGAALGVAVGLSVLGTQSWRHCCADALNRVQAYSLTV